jgi:hypothetical protein
MSSGLRSPHRVRGRRPKNIWLRQRFLCQSRRAVTSPNENPARVRKGGVSGALAIFQGSLNEAPVARAARIQVRVDAALCVSLDESTGHRRGRRHPCQRRLPRVIQIGHWYVPFLNHAAKLMMRLPRDKYVAPTETRRSGRADWRLRRGLNATAHMPIQSGSRQPGSRRNRVTLADPPRITVHTT